MDPEINETILRLAYEGLRAKHPALKDVSNRFLFKSEKLRNMFEQVRSNLDKLGREGEIWIGMYVNPRQCVSV